MCSELKDMFDRHRNRHLPSAPQRQATKLGNKSRCDICFRNSFFFSPMSMTIFLITSSWGQPQNGGAAEDHLSRCWRSFSLSPNKRKSEMLEPKIDGLSGYHYFVLQTWPFGGILHFQTQIFGDKEAWGLVELPGFACCQLCESILWQTMHGGGSEIGLM